MLRTSQSQAEFISWFALLVGISVFGIEAYRWLVHRRRASQSLSWPMAEVKIERSSVNRSEGRRGGGRWTIRIVFAYRPAELLWFSGVYTQDVASEYDGVTQLHSLTGRRLFARYNPANPSEYFFDPYRDVFGRDLE